MHLTIISVTVLISWILMSFQDTRRFRCWSAVLSLYSHFQEGLHHRSKPKTMSAKSFRPAALTRLSGEAQTSWTGLQTVFSHIVGPSCSVFLFTFIILKGSAKKADVQLETWWPRSYCFSGLRENKTPQSSACPVHGSPGPVCFRHQLWIN